MNHSQVVQTGRRRCRTVSTILAIIAWGTACSPGLAAKDTSKTAPSTTSAPSKASAPATTESEPTTTTEPEPQQLPAVPLAPDDAAVLTDIAAFWESKAPGPDFKRIEPIDFERVQPFREGAMTCDGDPIVLSDVEDNAMQIYCEAEGPAIVWDEAFRTTDIDELGPAAFYGTLAHEYGHYIAGEADPFETSISKPGVRAEMFADCAVGAWLADAQARKFQPVDSLEALDQVMVSQWASSDMPNFDFDSEDAHGTGYDRIVSMLIGFDGGAQACADFRTEPPTIAADQVGVGDHQRFGEALTDSELSDLAVRTVEEFLDQPQPIKGMQATDDYFEFDDPDSLREDFGEAWVLTNVGFSTSAEAMEDRGYDPMRRRSSVFQACWTASLLGWLVKGNGTVSSITLEDLDAAIGTMLAFSNPDDPGVTFDMMRHLRKAFSEGPLVCVP